MSFPETYFISSEIVKHILKKETRVSKKGQAYCMVKPSTLRNIIFERDFKRMGKPIHSSADFYGFDRNQYQYQCYYH